MHTSLGFWFSECRRKQNISIGHYDKMEKWLPFRKYRLFRKISNYQPPNILVSGFLGINRKGISVSAITKKLKNGCHFINIDHTEKFQITDPPKFWSLVF